MADQLITGTTLIEDKRASGTSGLIWSCPGTNFVTSSVTADGAYNPDGDITAQDAAVVFFAPVFLPNGATITKVVVFGSDTAETWTLSRRVMSTNGSGESMASAVIGTEDTSITEPIVDNSTYAYFLTTSSMETNDEVNGARIIYTL